jgi:hypothetical protein
MPLSVKQIKQRAGFAFDQTLQWRPTLERAYRLGAPNREGFDRGLVTGGIQGTPGERKTVNVYDGTYAHSINRLANDVMVGMFPPWARWYEFQAGLSVPQGKQDEIEGLLESPEKILWAAISDSNFYSALHPSLIDSIFSTGCIYVEPGMENIGLNFRSVPPWECGFENGSHGKISNIYRKYTVKAHALADELGEDADIPMQLKATMSKDPQADIPILSAVVQEGVKKYTQKLIWEEGDHVLLERGPWRNNPYVAFRWSVLTGETHGRGPALDVASTAYTLNELMRLALLNINFSVYGMYSVLDDGILNPAAFAPRPFAMIPVASNETANPSIRNIPRDLNSIDLAAFGLEDLRSQIKRGLFVDDLQGIEQNPKMTATEVVERQAIVAKDKGAAYGRIEAEAMVPLLGASMEVLQDQGTMPKEIELDGKVIRVRAVSPLAKAQAFDEVQNIRAFNEDVVRMAETDPTVTSVPDQHKMARRIWSTMGGDSNLLRSEDDVEEYLEERAPGELASLTGQEPPEGGEGAPPVV